MRRFLLLAATALVVGLGISVPGASAGVTTVTLAGSGTGTVVSEPNGIACSNVPGATQTSCVHDWGFDFSNSGLTATAGPGSAFVGWTGTGGGTCSGTVNPCVTTLLIFDMAVTATFEPAPDAPTVDTGALSQVAFPSATVSGTVNPNSSVFPVTACYVEFGLTADYGERAPCRPRAIPPGASPVAVSASIGVLDPGKTYHYRLVAANAGGASYGPDQTFTSGVASTDQCPNAAIRAQQGALAQRLPDCRAYEMVSPPFSAGQNVNVIVGAADGNRVALESVGGFAGTESLQVLGTSYTAERSGSGWTTSSIAPPASLLPYSGTLSAIDFTRDMSRSLWFGNLRADEGTTRFTPIVRDPDGSFHVAGPTQDDSSMPVGASEDLRTVVQKTATRLPVTDGTTNSRSTAPPAATSLYVSTRGADDRLSVRQVAYRAGAMMFPATCSVEAGGVTSDGGSLYGRNAVSQDGRRIFFTAGLQCGTSAVLRRVWAKVGAADPIDLSASQCEATCGAAAPAQFRGASRDGSRVYFATEQRLLPEDQDTSDKNDLYEYDFNATGQKLRLVTGSTAPAGANVAVSSLFRVSQDGSYVYFVATGRPLTTTPNARGVLPQSGGTNLYVYHRTAGEASGTTRFVGALDSLNDQQINLSSDGRYSLFSTSANLTGGRAPGDAYADLYRYDALTDELARVWTSDPEHNGTNRVDGARMNDSNYSFGGAPSPASVMSSSGGWYGNQGLSDDGSLVGFTTAEPLSRDDRNASFDAYLWDASTGRLTMLTDGTTKVRNPATGSSFKGMTPSGDSLFVSSASPFVSAHDSGQIAVYAVRRDGGFHEEAPPGEPCVGDGCQPPTAPPPASGNAGGSSAYVGPGNVLMVEPSTASVRVGRVGSVRGTATRVAVRVSGKGTVSVSGANLVRTSVSANKAGSVRAAVRLSKAGQRALRRTRRVTVRASVRFVPAGGKAATARVAVTFTAKATKRKTKATPRSTQEVRVLSSDVRKGR